MGFFRKQYPPMSRYFVPPDHAVLYKVGKLHVTDTSSFETATAKVPFGSFLVGYYKMGNEVVMPILDNAGVFKQFEKLYFSDKKMLRCFYIVESKDLKDHVEYVV